ncbi:MAG: hypothetical protein ABFC77_15595 [Thermoguttaceae bacterium]
MDYVYDCETYPNCFLICFSDLEGNKNNRMSFEISEFRNDIAELKHFILKLAESGGSLIGFNNLSFDYPILHHLLMGRHSSPQTIYENAQALINSQNKFEHLVRPSDWIVPQIDLLKIHHFDNKARMTGLKALEFNMRMENISDLPFPVGTHLSHHQIALLRDYCFHDVEATRLFYHKTTDQLAFRKKLNGLYPGRDFTNANDVKIGKEFFQMRLEQAGVQCYDYSPAFGRLPRQTPRPMINLADCVPSYVYFNTPEFESVRQRFLTTTITETKGAFKDMHTVSHGLEFVFGTGGIHASVEGKTFTSNDTHMLYDVDVTSMYPSIAIEHGLYPAHLGPTFVDVYRSLREERARYGKGTPENAMLKLALNGVYGASNDKFSIFYDPLYTMRTTIGGQLSLAMLAEQLQDVYGLQIIQANTDGITMYLPRSSKFLVDAVCWHWQRVTSLALEYAEFDLMVIADVNNYIARKTDGTVKRKGRYEYDIEWHQNGSALVVPKVAEKVLLEGAPIRETLRNWPDLFDFFIRAKANKGMKLVLDMGGWDQELERTQRYYVSMTGKGLFKIMPPLARTPTVWRRVAIQSGWVVCPCNNVADATAEINIDFYANEVEKLVMGVI